MFGVAETRTTSSGRSARPRAPVAVSGSPPTWICLVSKPQFSLIVSGCYGRNPDPTSRISHSPAPTRLEGPRPAFTTRCLPWPRFLAHSRSLTPAPSLQRPGGHPPLDGSDARWASRRCRSPTTWPTSATSSRVEAPADPVRTNPRARDAAAHRTATDLDEVANVVDRRCGRGVRARPCRARRDRTRARRPSRRRVRDRTPIPAGRAPRSWAGYLRAGQIRPRPATASRSAISSAADASILARL